MQIPNTPDFNKLPGNSGSMRTSRLVKGTVITDTPLSPENRKHQQGDQEVNHSIKRKRTRNKDTVGPWKLGKTLGKGSSGRVRLAKHVETGQLAAIKIVSKRKHKRNTSTATQAPSNNSHDQDVFEETPIPYGIEREIIIMKLVTHSNVMALYEVWENKSELYLVLEYVDGGELFDYLVAKGKLSEKEATYYFKQIIEGVSYLHRFNICHRDLKPENLLLDKKNKTIKIADFGMAALELSDKLLKTSCGSPHYASPEIVTGKNYHGSPSDIWSCGIILFALLAGHLPFNDNNVKKLLLKVQSGKYQMPESLSDEAKDLISKMLVLDPSKRISIQEVMYHPLLTKYSRSTKNKSNSNIFKLFNEKKELVELKSNNGMQLPVTPNIVTLRSASDIDYAILESLQILWHGVTKETIISNLLCPDTTDEKIFYSLLHQYQINQHNISNQQNDVQSTENNSPLETKVSESLFNNMQTNDDLLPAVSTTKTIHDNYENENDNENDITFDQEPMAPVLQHKSQFSSRKSSMNHIDAFRAFGKSPSMTKTNSGVKSFVVSRSISSKPGLGIMGVHHKSPSVKGNLSRSSSIKTKINRNGIGHLTVPNNFNIPESPRRFFRSPSTNVAISPFNGFRSQSKKSLYSLNSISKKSINLKNYLINDHYIENEVNPLPEYKNEFAVLCEQILFQEGTVVSPRKSQAVEDSTTEHKTDKPEAFGDIVQENGKTQNEIENISSRASAYSSLKLPKFSQPAFNLGDDNNENHFRRLSLDPRLKKSTMQNLSQLLKAETNRKRTSIYQNNQITDKRQSFHQIQMGDASSTNQSKLRRESRSITANFKSVTAENAPATVNKSNRNSLAMISLPSGFLKSTNTFQDLSSYIKAMKFDNDDEEADDAVSDEDKDIGESVWDQTTIASKIETARMVTSRKPKIVALSQPLPEYNAGPDENLFEDIESAEVTFSSSASYPYDTDIENSDSDMDLKTHRAGDRHAGMNSSMDETESDIFPGDVGGYVGKSRRVASIDSFDGNNLHPNVIHTATTVDVRGSLYVNRPGIQGLPTAMTDNYRNSLTPTHSFIGDISSSSDHKYDDFASDSKGSRLNVHLMKALEQRDSENNFNSFPRQTSADIIAKFELTPDKKTKLIGTSSEEKKRNTQHGQGQGEDDEDYNEEYSFLRVHSFSNMDPTSPPQFLKFSTSATSLDMATMFKNLDDELKNGDMGGGGNQKFNKISKGFGSNDIDETDLSFDDEYDTSSVQPKDIEPPINPLSSSNQRGIYSKSSNKQSLDQKRLLELSVDDTNDDGSTDSLSNEINKTKPTEEIEKVVSKIKVLDQANKKKKRVTMLFDNDEDKKFSLKFTNQENGKPVKKRVSIMNLRLKNKSGTNTPLTPTFEVDPSKLESKDLKNSDIIIHNKHTRQSIINNGQPTSSDSGVGGGNNVSVRISKPKKPYIEKRDISNSSTNSTVKRENWFSKMINRLGRRISSNSYNTSEDWNSSGTNSFGKNKVIEEKLQHYTNIPYEKLNDLCVLQLSANNIKFQEIKNNSVSLTTGVDSNRHVIYNCESITSDNNTGVTSSYKFQLEIDSTLIIISKKFNERTYIEDKERFEDFNNTISNVIKNFSSIEA